MQYSFSALSVTKHEENKPKKTRLSYTKLPCRLCFFFFFFFFRKHIDSIFICLPWGNKKTLYNERQFLFIAPRVIISN